MGVETEIRSRFYTLDAYRDTRLDKKLISNLNRKTSVQNGNGGFRLSTM